MKKILLTSLCFLLTGAAFGATVESGSAFLKMDTAARPAALAGAYTADSGHIDALAYNPGGMADLVQQEAAFTHAEWLEGARYDSLAYGAPTRYGTFGVSAIRLGYGDLEGRDATRVQTGNFEAYDSAYTLGYAQRAASNIGLGGAVKFIDRKIGTDRASSYALDFGGVGKITGQPFWVGASVLNIGPGVKFLDQSDPLPLTLALGGVYERNRSMKVTADLKHEPNDQRTTAVTGIEYSPVGPLTLRAGYRLPLVSTGEKSWDMDNLRGGMGLVVSRIHLDYALVPFGELGVTHRFTLSIFFGDVEDPTLQKNMQTHARALPDSQEISTLIF